LHYNLYSGSDNGVLDKARERMGRAACEGIHKLNTSDMSSPSWNTSNVFEKFAVSWNNSNTDQLGNYNGLDYMLLHNLYKLTPEILVTSTIGPPYIIVTDIADHTYAASILEDNISANGNQTRNAVSYNVLTSSLDNSAIEFGDIPNPLNSYSINYKSQTEIDLKEGFDSGEFLLKTIVPNPPSGNTVITTKIDNNFFDAEIISIDCNTFSASNSNARAESENSVIQQRIEDTQPITEEIEIAKSLTIYPVPTENSVTIAIEGYQSADVYLKVTDQLGKVLFTKNEMLNNNKLYLNVASLASGFYHIEIHIENEIYNRVFSKI